MNKDQVKAHMIKADAEYDKIISDATEVFNEASDALDKAYKKANADYDKALMALSAPEKAA